MRKIQTSQIGEYKKIFFFDPKKNRPAIHFLPFRLAFGKLVSLVDRELSESLDHPARPLDFERIDLADIRQAEMLLERHTSEISPAAHLAKLFAAARFE